MAPCKLKKAIRAVKDQTSIGLAKVTTSSSLSHLEVAIVRATSHEECHPDERHVGRILTLTAHSHALVGSCVTIIAKRLNKTKNWVVAVKTLVLVHRLLAKGNRRAYEQEIFFSTRRGTRFLNMSDFRDASAGKLDSWDYSAFVRAYAMYLDERLDLEMQGKKWGGYGHHGGDEEEVEGRRHGGSASGDLVARPTPVREMKNESVFSRARNLEQLLGRLLACRPTGAAKHNRLVVVALYSIVRESFQLYYDVTEIIGTLIDRFMQLEIPDMVRVHGIFHDVSKQFDQLDSLYDWCKTIRIVRPSECPKVERIPQKKLDMMDDFIHQKSAMRQNRRARSSEPKPEPVEKIIREEPKHDIAQDFPLVPSEGFVEDEKGKFLEKTGFKDEEVKKNGEIGDLLNLGEELPSTREEGDKLALVLFDGDLATTAVESTTTSWEAFKDTSVDWETALVHSASHLSNQKASFAGGFDTTTLDSMYRKGSNVTLPTTGSASSVALGAVGRPTALALPAPPHAARDRGTHDFSSNTDPFSASLSIAPPVHVQMYEMERKRRLLIEEQLMWQQYARYGDARTYWIT